MITFRATCINSQTIQRPDVNNNSKPAYFVELDPNSAKDLETITKTACSWKHGINYAEDILRDFEDCNWIGYANCFRFFALTTQDSKFENLKSDEILGLASIIEGAKQLKLKYLQVDPKNNYHADVRAYKGIGTTLFKAIDKLFPDKNIVLESIRSAMNFYKKLGLEQLGNGKDFILRR